MTPAFGPGSRSRAARHIFRAGIIGVSLSLGALARAEPGQNATDAPAPVADPSPKEAQKDEARGYFENGLALFDQGKLEAALAEFLRSRATYPTRAAAQNAALCLRKLGRAAEALDMFEEVLRFTSLPDEDRALCEREIATLRLLVGNIAIESSEPGATVVIDDRGSVLAPFAKPLRVDAGAHVVRVSKAGFRDFEQRVDVAGGQTVELRVTLALIAPDAALRAPPLALPSPAAPQKPGSLLPAGIAYGVGAASLGVFAATGIAATVLFHDVNSRCRASVCLESDRGNLQTVSALGAASTVGLVVGGVGVAAGTVFVLTRRRGGGPPRPTTSASILFDRAIIGRGSLVIEGRF